MQLSWTCFHLQWAPVSYSELLVPTGFLSPFLMCFGLPGTGISFMQQQQIMRQRLGLFETCHIFWDGYTPGCCLSVIKVAKVYALTASGWHGDVPETHPHGAFCHHTDSCGKTFSSAWDWHLLLSTADTKLGQHNSSPSAAQEQPCARWFAHSRKDVQQSRDLRQLYWLSGLCSNL